MNVKYPVGVLHSFSIKNIFYEGFLMNPRGIEVNSLKFF